MTLAITVVIVVPVIEFWRLKIIYEFWLLDLCRLLCRYGNLIDTSGKFRVIRLMAQRKPCEKVLGEGECRRYRGFT